jgi:hypothetical protein
MIDDKPFTEDETVALLNFTLNEGELDARLKAKIVQRVTPRRLRLFEKREDRPAVREGIRRLRELIENEKKARLQRRLAARKKARALTALTKRKVQRQTRKTIKRR